MKKAASKSGSFMSFMEERFLPVAAQLGDSGICWPFVTALSW